MKKKTKIMILAVIALAIAALSLTYAYWLVTKSQTGQNFVGSACLDISISNEENDIDLGSQFPMSDDDGANLTPYTFTVTNNCSSAIDYEVALEVLNTSTMSDGSVKAMIDTKTPKVLTGYKEAATKLSNANKSYRLAVGTLGASGSDTESATHELRLWIADNAPTTEMNKMFKSKISINVGQGIENVPTLAENILSKNTLIETTPNFSLATASSDVGLYKMADDLGDSYYFRGNPSNNYVKFASEEVVHLPNHGTYYLEACKGASNSGAPWSVEDCEANKTMDSLYWRIIRVNGDGSIRMIYDGRTLAENGEAHEAAIRYPESPSYHQDFEGSKYLGYTYAEHGLMDDQMYNGGYITSSGDAIYTRPVISLKADVPFTGNGTIDDPYVIGD